MALRNPPSWLEGGSHPAANDRMVIDGFLSLTGVVGPDDLKVTIGGGLKVTVAAGAVFIPGNVSTNQGVYHAINDSPETLTLATAPTDNSRIDAVVVTVNDSFVLGTEDSVVFQVITGTPSSTPQIPTIPKNSILLASVLVGVNVTSIIATNISDKRGSRATALGGVINCTSTTRPASPYNGMTIFEEDTGFMRVWRTNAWKVVVDTDFLPTLLNPPRVYAYQTSAVSMANNVYTAMQMQATRYDSHTMHDNSVNNTRLTCKVAGLYHVQGQAYSATADTGKRRLAIFQNGSAVAYNGFYNTTSTDTHFQVSAEVPMNVGDYVDLRVYQAAGNNLNSTVGMYMTFIAARWVSPK